MKALPLLVFVGGLLAASLIPIYALVYLLYYVVGLPLRRQERARFFLDLIETGLAQGRSPEHTVISISRSRDSSVGVRFHLLAAYLESGWGLVPALRKVGGLLPPQLTAMLQVGQEIGDPGRVLPACRVFLKDGASQVQSAYNYLIVLVFVLTPAIPLVFWAMTVFILPKYQTIIGDLLENTSLPLVPFSLIAGLAKIQLALTFLFYGAAVLYIGGARLFAWLRAGLNIPVFDSLILRVPWRRKRMQRDFAAMLAVLLDAGVPEARAVQLAAASTGNAAFGKRAERVVTNLALGQTIAEAIATFDESGELRWRLRNALHSGRNFFAALQGWLESLDASAFRQQQAFAQVVTSSLVIYNGVMVGLFAVFVFRGVTLVIEEGVLW